MQQKEAGGRISERAEDFLWAFSKKCSLVFGKCPSSCFLICLIFQNNLAKDRKSFAEKLCEPRGSRRVYSCQSLTCDVDLVPFLISLKNLSVTQGGVWDEQKPLFLLSGLSGWEIHHVPCAVGAVDVPGGVSQDLPCSERGWAMLSEGLAGISAHYNPYPVPGVMTSPSPSR